VRHKTTPTRFHTNTIIIHKLKQPQIASISIKLTWQKSPFAQIASMYLNAPHSLWGKNWGTHGVYSPIPAATSFYRPRIDGPDCPGKSSLRMVSVRKEEVKCVKQTFTP
jgi:hypothetical protein